VHTGDGINACFDDATDAAHCALAIQTDLAAWHDAEPDLSLSARCGLSTGQVIPSDEGLFGLVQSETSRLCAMAGAGQVLAAGSTAALLDDAGIRVTKLGDHTLRGMPSATAVFSLELS
jgi:class 3 adenylate cyclase